MARLAQPAYEQGTAARRPPATGQLQLGEEGPELFALCRAGTSALIVCPKLHRELVSQQTEELAWVRAEQMCKSVCLALVFLVRQAVETPLRLSLNPLRLLELISDKPLSFCSGLHTQSAALVLELRLGIQRLRDELAMCGEILCNLVRDIHAIRKPAKRSHWLAMSQRGSCVGIDPHLRPASALLMAAYRIILSLYRNQTLRDGCKSCRRINGAPWRLPWHGTVCCCKATLLLVSGWRGKKDRCS